MRPRIVLGLARAEARLARRLVRYWVFAALAVFVCLAFYLYYAFLHGFSSYSASIGAINPRFLVAAVGFWGILIFSAGLVFLAFDVRHRDVRERISEVLDSRPYTNLELVTGRFLGLLLMGWLPMVTALLLMQSIGLLARTFEWPFGEPLEPWSALGFVFSMAIPAFAFVLALVFLISLLLRNRLGTAVAILLLLGVWFGLFFFKTPVDLAPAVDLTGTYTLNFTTEMVSIFTASSHLQRAGVLLLALGLLGLSAAAHPRPDSGQRKVWALGGTALLLLGGAALGYLVKVAYDARALNERWRAAHEARRGEPEPDIEAIRGSARISPGEILALDLAVELRTPGEEELSRALFSFNPGLRIESLQDSAGQALDFTHKEGLLEVELGAPLVPGASTTLSLQASGRPETTFAYLDSSRRLVDMTLSNANMAILGYFPAIFDRRFVALMPGIRWLPAAGADVGRDDPGRRTDYFHLDLSVEAPADWLVAGPGRRLATDAGGVSRFRPSAPLPEVALIASRFTSRSIEVGGIELELLLHPEHTRNLAVFEDASQNIRSWLEERFAEAAEMGLPYPYDALSLVEVPTVLQGFAGGWRMDTAMAPPGLLLIRESSFPTSRFDARFSDPEDFEDHEGGLAQAKLEALQVFFENDFNGGNVFLGVARQFFLHQTSGRGKGALALDYVCDNLTNRLVTGKEGYFSVHVFSSQSDMQQLLGTAFGTFFTGGVSSFNEAMHQAITNRPEIWEQALGVSLAEMDPWEDPGRTVNVLVLKGGAMARSLVDGLGRQQAGTLLATLRERFSGQTFDRQDLLATAAELGIDLEGLVGDFLEATDLPGFIASQGDLYRLTDSEDGVPRYQLALHLRNDEEAPGLVRLRYVLDEGGAEGNRDREEKNWQESDPFRLAAGEAVEIGMVLSKPPSEVRVAPYLALNRSDFAVVLPTLDEEKLVSAEPFAGVRPSAWRKGGGLEIVVDDLDPGFAVVEDETRSGLRLGALDREETLDQGLPVGTSFQLRGDWSRLSAGEAWGKYRRTLAAIKAGEGTKRAVFTAELPRSGPWLLEFYMLPPRSLRWKRGTYHLRVEDPSGSHQLTFDASAAEEGWNALGELEMAAGEVRVALSDETDGRAVLADAIRWRPVGRTAVQEEKIAEKAPEETTDG